MSMHVQASTSFIEVQRVIKLDSGAIRAIFVFILT